VTVQQTLGLCAPGRYARTRRPGEKNNSQMSCRRNSFYRANYHKPTHPSR